jgi:hypothetical protein
MIQFYGWPSARVRDAPGQVCILLRERQLLVL